MALQETLLKPLMVRHYQDRRQAYDNWSIGNKRQFSFFSLYNCCILADLTRQLELGQQDLAWNVGKVGSKDLIDIALSYSRVFTRFAFHNGQEFGRHYLLVLMLWCNQLEQFEDLKKQISPQIVDFNIKFGFNCDQKLLSEIK